MSAEERKGEEEEGAGHFCCKWEREDGTRGSRRGGVEVLALYHCVFLSLANRSQLLNSKSEAVAWDEFPSQP